MKLTHTLDIDRRPDQVFPWVADPERAKAWMTSVSRTEILERRPGLVGTTFRETVSDERGSTELTGVVTACSQDQLLAFHLEGRFNAVDVEYRLTETARGTRVTMRADVRFKGPLKVPSALLWPLFRRRVLAQFVEECAALKRLCEQES